MGNAVLTRYTVPLDMIDVESGINGYYLYELNIPRVEGKSVEVTSYTETGKNYTTEKLIATFNKNIKCINYKKYTAVQDHYSTSGRSNITGPKSKSEYRENTVNHVQTTSESLLVYSYSGDYGTYIIDNYEYHGYGAVNLRLIIRNNSLYASLTGKINHLYLPDNITWALTIASSEISPFYVGIEFS